jgi:hypothetical protein
MWNNIERKSVFFASPVQVRHVDGVAPPPRRRLFSEAVSFYALRLDQKSLRLLFSNDTTLLGAEAKLVWEHRRVVEHIQC